MPNLKTISDVEEEFDKQSTNKVKNHEFNGSCLYNNNENGKGHKECRFPFNPGVEDPNRTSFKGTQCLELQEEHFNAKQFYRFKLEEILNGLRGEKQNEEFAEKDLLKAKYPATIEMLGKQAGYNQAISEINEKINQIIKKV